MRRESEIDGEKVITITKPKITWQTKREESHVNKAGVIGKLIERRRRKKKENTFRIILLF